jgi:hydroxyethylthiazole kinase-like uncharacterized protein yjeF
MIPIITPEQAAESDRLSAEAGVTVEELMERAGWAVARAAADVAGGAYGRRAVVLCGKGNNGGDGLVAARHLERWGMGVTALLLSAPEGFQGAARTSFRRYAEAGGRWRLHSDAALSRELRRADVAVDAIFGTGFRGAPRGEAGQAIGRLHEFHAEGGAVVAVDIPSGGSSPPWCSTRARGGRGSSKSSTSAWSECGATSAWWSCGTWCGSWGRTVRRTRTRGRPGGRWWWLVRGP